MARKKVTSSDVAEKAGVSQATVSMVLNHKYNVSFSRETVEKVESAARELGYQLPGHKNKKENKKEKMIVVFCPTITSPYYVMLLQGIEAVANERGYGVFICNTQRDARLEEKYLRMIRAMAPQGIIYACNPHPDYISQVEEMARSIPLVIISNKEKISTVDAINQDNTEVGRLMARHLLDLGHRDVAFITPPLTRRQWQRSKRVDGFVREFEKAGLSGHVIIRAADESVDRRNPKTDSEYSMGYALTRSLLEDGSRFTAIAGQNDMMAIGAVDALQENVGDGVEHVARRHARAETHGAKDEPDGIEHTCHASCGNQVVDGGKACIHLRLGVTSNHDSLEKTLLSYIFFFMLMNSSKKMLCSLKKQGDEWDGDDGA